jgi:hypothetical protein
MADQRWQQAKEIFNQALTRSTGERPAFLTQACADDLELHGEVQSLLASYHKANQFMAAITKCLQADESPSTKSFVDLVTEAWARFTWRLARTISIRNRSLSN